MRPPFLRLNRRLHWAFFKSKPTVKTVMIGPTEAMKELQIHQLHRFSLDAKTHLAKQEER